jgi:RNA polymerase sigma-70 factor (ECF subfamily)
MSPPPDPEPAAGADEARLVEGLIAREPGAVSAFLERTHHPVYWMACRLTRDPDRRRDWTHEVLLGILDDLARGRFVLRHPGGFWSWFRKRAHFRLIDEHRRLKRREARETAVGEDEAAAAIESVAGGEDPAETLARFEALSAVERCLERIGNPDHARALALRLLEDLSYEDVARGMAAPLNTVRAWIRRGRIALRRCLASALGLAQAPPPPGTPATSPSAGRSSSVEGEP